jgi:WD40 repeat protein
MAWAVVALAVSMAVDARDARWPPLGTRPPAREPSAAFSPDGTTLAVLDGRGRIRHWDVATRKPGKRTRLEFADNEFPEQVRYTPAGDLAVILCRYRGFESGPGGYRQGTIEACLWNLAAGRRTGFVPAFYGGLDVSPAGDRLAFDNEVWDLATGRRLRKVDLPKGMAFGVRFSPDGKAVAYRICESLAQDGSLAFVADAGTGKKLAQVGVFDWDRYRFDVVSEAVFTPDGKAVACTGPDDGPGVAIRDLATGRATRSVTGPEPGGVVGFGPDGRSLVTWSRSRGTVRLWERATGGERRAVRVREWADEVLLSPDGKTVAVRKGTAIEFKGLWD